MTEAAAFDVFLSYASADRPAVESIATWLRGVAGLRPFLDSWHLVAGRPWQDELAEALSSSATAAVFVGATGRGAWMAEEARVAIDRAARERDEFRVIPVLLPGADEGSVGRFLAQRTWVDFRHGVDDEGALARLAAGVRGEAIAGDSFVLPDDPAPYRGLLRFDAEHSRFYFGRRTEIDRALTTLNAERFVAIVGASGSGKSSLMRAGIVPSLSAGAGNRDGARVLVCRPQGDPFRSVAEQIATLSTDVPSLSMVDYLTSRFESRDDGMVTAITPFTAASRQPVVLAIDTSSKNSSAPRAWARRKLASEPLGSSPISPRSSGVRMIRRCQRSSHCGQTSSQRHCRYAG